MVAGVIEQLQSGWQTVTTQFTQAMVEANVQNRFATDVRIFVHTLSRIQTDIFYHRILLAGWYVYQCAASGNFVGY